MTTDPDSIADCGDNGCIFRDPSRKGLRTNGGCEHLKCGPHETRRLLQLAAKELVRLRGEVHPPKLGPVCVITRRREPNGDDGLGWGNWFTHVIVATGDGTERILDTVHQDQAEKRAQFFRDAFRVGPQP